MDIFFSHVLPGSFDASEARSVQPSELTAIRRGMCAVMKDAASEKYSMRRTQRELERFLDSMGPREEVHHKIKMLRGEDWRSLSVAPSNWVSRAAVGLASKAPTVKRPQGGQIVQPHAFHRELRHRWEGVTQEEKKNFFEVTASLAESYEQRGFAFAEAAHKYRDAMALAREWHGEGSKSFLNSAQAFLRCVHKTKKSRVSFELQKEAVRVYAKLRRMSTADTPCRVNNKEDKADLLIFLDQQITSSALTNLLIFVASQLERDESPLCDTHRQIGYLWSFVFRDATQWLNIGEDEHRRREACHKFVSAYLQCTGADTEQLPALPPFVCQPDIPSRFFQDTSKDSGYLKNSPELKAFLRTCFANREKVANTGETSRVAATLLVTGPPATGKTASAKSLAHHLGAPMIKIDGVDVKSKWFGESAKNLLNFLKQAIAYAQLNRHANIVVMFDELDGIATKRDDNEVDANSTNQELLMVLLDMIAAEELEYKYTDASGDVRLGQAVVVATSNVTGELDEALVGRFQCRIHMPRWSPEQNLSLLRDRLGSLSQDAVGGKGLLQFTNKVGSRENAAQWLTRMAVSRLDLRMMNAVAEVMSAAIKEEQQKDWGALSWRLFSELRSVRLSEGGVNGALVPNARYTYEEEFEGVGATSSTTKMVKLESNRVCLAGLAEPAERGLDLRKNPYATFFELQTETCMLVVHHLGVTFAFLEDLTGSGGHVHKRIHDCFSGDSPERNRKKLTDSGLRFRQHYLRPGPTFGTVDAELLEEKENATSSPVMKEFVVKSKFANLAKISAFPTFLWSEIVEGAKNFDQACAQLIHREGGKTTMSLEFFVEIDAE